MVKIKPRAGHKPPENKNIRKEAAAVKRFFKKIFRTLFKRSNVIVYKLGKVYKFKTLEEAFIFANKR